MNIQLTGNLLTVVTARETCVDGPATIGATGLVGIGHPNVHELGSWPAETIAQADVARRATRPVFVCVEIARQCSRSRQFIAVFIVASF